MDSVCHSYEKRGTIRGTRYGTGFATFSVSGYPGGGGRLISVRFGTVYLILRVVS